MFTQFKKGKWNYMFLAAVATVAVAALATFFSTTTVSDDLNSQSNRSSDQTVSGRYTQYNGSAVRFVN